MSVESADLDVRIDFEVGYQSDDFTGTHIEEGYTAIFNPSWTLEIKDAATAEYLEMENASTMRIQKALCSHPHCPLARNQPWLVGFARFPGEARTLYATFHDRSREIEGVMLPTYPRSESQPHPFVTSTKVSEAIILKALCSRPQNPPYYSHTDFEINDVPNFLLIPRTNSISTILRSAHHY